MAVVSCHTYRQAGRQAGRQTDRQTDRQTEMHTYIHTYIHNVLYMHENKTLEPKPGTTKPMDMEKRDRYPL